LTLILCLFETSLIIDIFSVTIFQSPSSVS